VIKFICDKLNDFEDCTGLEIDADFFLKDSYNFVLLQITADIY